jgi:hypothetical protein
MKLTQYGSLAFLIATTGCTPPAKDETSMVTITDPKLNSDICAAVNEYAKTVLELGGEQFRINGHLWKSFSPLIPEGYEIISEFSPADYSQSDDLSQLIGVGTPDSIRVWVDFDAQEPAPKLFMIMDWVEKMDTSCWINISDRGGESSVRVYSNEPKANKGQRATASPSPAT